ncbi:MAG: hypothetical protein NVS1B14_04740 [Vulcanimicrobiaceae bacterium]
MGKDRFAQTHVVRVDCRDAGNCGDAMTQSGIQITGAGEAGQRRARERARDKVSPAHQLPVP